MVSIILNAESLLVEALVAAIIVQALLSWFAPTGTGTRFSLLLSDITDPLLMPLRRMIPPFGALDLSPLIAILLLQFLVGPLLFTVTSRLAGV